MPPPLVPPIFLIQWTFVPVVVMASFVGLVIMISMFETTRTMRPAHRTLPNILVPTVTGLGLWGVIFAAIQSHTNSQPTGYSVTLVVVSLLVITAAFIAAYFLASNAYQSSKPLRSVLAATLLVATAVCVMHYSLMGAIIIPDMRPGWSTRDILISISVPFGLALLSTFIRSRHVWQRITLVSALGAASVAWLHIYSVLTSIPLPTPPRDLVSLSSETISLLAVSTFSVLVLALTLVSGGYIRVQSRFIRNLEDSIEAMPVGLAFYDKQDRLMLWNERYANLNPDKHAELKTGMSYRKVLEAGIKDAIIPEKSRKDGSWISEHTNDHGEGDWLHPYTSGENWIQVQSRRTRDAGLVTTVADFTAQKQSQITLENQLTEANSANLAKSRFLANMSHEIRTPLNGVMAVADTLSRTNLNIQQTEMVNLIRQSSHTLQILLGEILDLARVETGQLTLSPEPVDLEVLLDEVIQLHATAAHNKGVSFNMSISPAAQTWVSADPVRLKQILGNILSNAVKFTHEGHIDLTVNAHENLFHFIIADTGIGFPPEFKPRLFGRFEQADSATTRRYGGSGLGLAICSELVTMMKGTIDADSTVGSGSAFSITLPLTRITAPTTQSAFSAQEETGEAVAEDSAGQGLRILLADDNATNRRVVQLILETTQARMSEAENGKEALEAYHTAPFDLILMDMQMPVMDGLTAVRAIRQHEKETGLPPTPIIMLTANAMPEHVSTSLEAGADAHLAKPFNVSQLLELTQRLTAQAA